MALLEKVCHWRVDFEVSKAHTRTNVALSTSDQDVALSYCPVPAYTLPCSHYGDNRLNL